MPSQHGRKARAFRPEPEEYAAAKDNLEQRGRAMDAFLRACLRWLNRDPDRALGTLAPYWPDPRPTGRPARKGDGSAGESPADSDVAPTAGGPNDSGTTQRGARRRQAKNARFRVQ